MPSDSSGEVHNDGATRQWRAAIRVKKRPAVSEGAREEVRCGPGRGRLGLVLSTVRRHADDGQGRTGEDGGGGARGTLARVAREREAGDGSVRSIQFFFPEAALRDGRSL